MTLKAIYDLAPVYCTQLQPSCPSCSSPDMPKGFTCFTVLYLSSTPLCSSPWQPQCLLPSFRFLFSITFPDDLNQNINLPYHYLSLSLVYFSFQHLPQPDNILWLFVYLLFSLTRPQIPMRVRLYLIDSESPVSTCNWMKQNSKAKLFTELFELWCWRRFLRVPWTARRSNQSILKEISPGCSLEGWMFELKLQYFWPLGADSWLIWKDPDAGKDWGREEKGTTEDEMVGWHHRLNGHGFGWTLGVGDGQGRPGVLRFMGSQRVGHDWATELNWKH